MRYCRKKMNNFFTDTRHSIHMPTVTSSITDIIRYTGVAVVDTPVFDASRNAFPFPENPDSHSATTFRPFSAKFDALSLPDNPENVVNSFVGVFIPHCVRHTAVVRYLICCRLLVLIAGFLRCISIRPKDYDLSFILFGIHDNGSIQHSAEKAMNPLVVKIEPQNYFLILNAAAENYRWNIGSYWRPRGTTVELYAPK